MSKYIGVSVPRVDGVKKVTGAAKYVGDMKWPRMLYAKCVKSPYAHAKILSIDVSAAKALKGVHDVITGDYYTKRGGLYLEDKNFLAVNTVKFCGEPVVAVAAETPEIAEAACELVKVEYEPLPVINNPMEGMAKDAILIHPELHTYKVVPIFHPQAHTNISHHHIIRKGDADAAFKYAEEHPDEYYITEHEYHVPHVQHTPIENHIAVAQYEPDGKCTVWASCQSPYAVRQALSASFDIPLNKMRIISPYVGGGFGAKAGTTIEGIIIPLAMHSKGRPVMMEYTREEEFVNSYVRQGLYTKIKTAVRKSDGKFLAVQNDFYWDGGAYTEYGVNIVKASGFASTGPYEFDNVKTDAYCVYTNNPVGGPYRGFGMCEIHFGIEQNIDEVAKEIGMDPIEIRRVNGLAPGKSTGTGEIMKSCGFLEALDQVAEAIQYDKPCDPPSGPHKVRGKGIAGGWKSPSQPTNAGSAAIIRMNEDGTFFLMTSGHDIGQGSDTALTQIAAEVLCCDPSKFTIRTGDTDHTPYEWQTVASRITYCAGNAIKLAAEDLKEKLLDLAQIKLGYIKRELYLEDGWIINRNHPESRMPMSDLALGLAFEDGSGYGGPAIGVGTFTLPNNINYDPATGYSPKPAAFWTTAVAGAEVEVDTETGIIEVKKMVESCDPGHIVNPELYKAQVEGGMMQALGTVLFEELKLKDGKVLNKSFVDYKIPTIDNAPETFIAMGVEHPEETGPYGARGIGEPAMVPGAPAIANAIYNATGCRFTEMPITPERMLKALQEKAAAEKK
ncbi:MAG: xanthine dehydrogenase family protein molybdopterin-binding subunit [Angelakisella sp.]|jgi:CO/xanthine dehydrogenase Mo-binding subunit|uniref:xanthine dehydrogenase family protein molybdopterin-binding subunit n=1 Tax=Angelakisella sp. TaxID=1935177 RepID=UPI003A3F62A9|nr:molybdopterin-dependent oxidoreductase [Angelakisella sp.]MBS6849608.1 molybdopterin-dependent oxidoreductase [Clostridiales bacterium]